MNTTNNITEAACLDFIKSEYKRLALPAWSSLGINTGVISPVWIAGHVLHNEKYEWVHGSGQTIEEAHAEFLAKVPPVGAALAAKLRADAAKLLADAAAIEAGKEVAA
jgi:hypothetical protein